MKSKVLVIIPAYNEASTIKKVVEDIKKNAKGVDYLVVNDGSTDNTLDILKKNKINHIDLFVNLGVFGAVQTGFIYALENNYDIAFQFDGDGQHLAKYIPELVEMVESGIDIAIGSRFLKEKKPWTFRMLGSRLLTAAIFLTTGKKITDPTSGLRAYNKETIKDYALDVNNPPEPDTLVYMIKKKKKLVEKQVEMRDRVYGQSYFNNISNSAKFMARMLVSIVLIQPFRKR